MAALRAPLSCLTPEELRAKVEDLQRGLAELSLKELASHRGEMLEREERVRDREAAVVKREEDVSRREASVATREEALRSGAAEETGKAPCCDHSPLPALLHTPTPNRSPGGRFFVSKPEQLQLTQKLNDDTVADVHAVPAMPVVTPVGGMPKELPSHLSSPRAKPAKGVSSPGFEAGHQAEEAVEAAMQHLDRMRRLSTPGKGNSSVLTAMFEQRVSDTAEFKKQQKKERQPFRRRSSGSVGALTSRLETRLDAKPAAPELLPQTRDDRSKLCHSARLPRSSDEGLASQQAAAPKLSLQRLLRQDQLNTSV